MIITSCSPSRGGSQKSSVAYVYVTKPGSSQSLSFSFSNHRKTKVIQNPFDKLQESGAIAGISSDAGVNAASIWMSVKGKRMRELTESIVRFYLAVSLLSIKETTSLLSQNNRSQSSQELELVTQAAVAHLDSYLKKLFDTGDSIEKGILDFSFGIVDPSTWNFSKFLPGKKCVNFNEEWGPMQSVD